MTAIIDGSLGITAPTYNGTVTAEYHVPVTAFKNRIINGAMQIDQRNAGASATITANPQYTLDRWFAGVTNASKISVQQNAGSVTPPAGFTKYLGVTSLAATTPSASEVYYMQQSIEGFNVADLGFGAAGASSITISFWVRSSLTGTFGAVLLNAGSNRSYPFNYTISSANTWTQITQTISGDTTGTWATDNSTGFQLRFGLGAGSTYQGVAGSWGTTNAVTTTTATNVVGTNGATFYITGVQLEKGSTATSFDYRSYGTELQLCQRYYYASGTGTAIAIGCVTQVTTVAAVFYKFPVTMRASPSVGYTSVGNYSIYTFYNTTGHTATGIGTFNNNSQSALVSYTYTTGATVGSNGTLDVSNSDQLTFSAEL